MKKTVVFNSRKNSVGTKTDITYQELLELYIKRCQLDNISEITIKGYRYASKYFLNVVGHDLRCSQINQDLIDDYKLSLINRLKPESVNSYIFKISPVVKYGFKQGYIEFDVLFTHMIEQQRLKDIYTTDELQKLLKRDKKQTFAEYRTWVIINFFISTGIRATELRELENKDIDLESKIVNLSHTKNREVRQIPLHPVLIKILKEYIDIRGGAASEKLFCNQFGDMMARSTLQIAVTKYAKKRGVERYSLHLFRHTFITLSVKKGINPLMLKQITGHKDFKMLDVYYNANASEIADIVSAFNPLNDFKQKKVISKKRIKI